MYVHYPLVVSLSISYPSGVSLDFKLPERLTGQKLYKTPCFAYFLDKLLMPLSPHHIFSRFLCTTKLSSKLPSNSWQEAFFGGVSLHKNSEANLFSYWLNWRKWHPTAPLGDRCLYKKVDNSVRQWVNPHDAAKRSVWVEVGKQKEESIWITII